MVRTYNELFLEGRNRLRLSQNCEDPSFEARTLLAFALDLPLEKLTASMNLYPSSDTCTNFLNLISRRENGEPLAYILGHWEFYGLPMIVNPSVLIPRMDTEVLINCVRAIYPDFGSELRILDLCSGSGCIGIALATLYPKSRIVLADVSEGANRIARQNIQLNHVSPRCISVHCDILNETPDRLGKYDIIVSNPPYICSEELPQLDSSVVNWEPALALDGGTDGYVFYRRILSVWTSCLKPRGTLLFEIGEQQVDYIRSLMLEQSFSEVRTALDTFGTERVIYGKKSQ